jgi:hypothetical protein
MRIWTAISIAGLLFSGCDYRLGFRHFAAPITPSAQHAGADFVVGDDGSITFLKDRLEVRVTPMTADELNRHFSTASVGKKGFAEPNPYVTADNPYTFGDWTPPGEKRPPERFTVFLLGVKNYAFPKVQLDPGNMSIVSTNGWNYEVLSQSALIEYYSPYAVAYAGNSRSKFRERTDILRRSLFKSDLIFSGQELQGFVIFPILDHDVEDFTVWVRDMALRFDYRGESIEAIDIPFRFTRETYYARRSRVEAE